MHQQNNVNSPRPESYMEKLRIAVLGSTKVGKSTMVHQLFFRRFIDSYVKTSLDIHHKKVVNVDIEVIDSGYLDCEYLRQLVMKNSCAFVFLFSLQDPSSFEFVIKARDELINLKGRDVPYVVVGNKTDVAGRCIPFALADCLCSLDWETEYCEISTKNSEQVIMVFQRLFSLQTMHSLFKQILSEDRKHQLTRTHHLSLIYKQHGLEVNHAFILDSDMKESKTIEGFRKFLCFS